MADFFSRLAGRALESSPRLSLRRPSRFDPVRGVAGDALREPQPLTVREETRPAGLRASGEVAGSEPTDGLLPPKPDGRSAVEVRTGSQEIGVSAQARPATGKHGSTDPRSEAADPRTAARAMETPHRGDPPTTDRRRGERTEAARSTMEQESAEPRLARERHRAPDPDIHEQSPAPESGTEGASVGRDDLQALERRLRPLLPRQPVPAPAVPTSVREGGGERGEGRDVPSPPPAVEVTIGSIEVRAAVPATSPAPSRPGPTLTLDDYLKRRDRGGP